MIILHITFAVPPESLPAVTDALRILHQNITKEPTCKYFNVYRFSQPGVIRVVEQWDEDANFLTEVYPSKEYLKSYLVKMEEIGWRDRKLEVLDEMEGLGVNRLAATS